MQRWHKLDSIWGWRWRAGNVLVVILLLGLASFGALQLINASRYRLTTDTLSLVGGVSPNLSKQLAYNHRTLSYEFNAQTGSAGEPTAMKAQVGGPSGNGKSLYGLDVRVDFSRGVTYRDNNTNLQFDMIPQFSGLNAKNVDGHLVFPLSGDKQAIYTLKSNGLKEDIVVQNATSDTMTFDYQLNLPDTLEARYMPDGSGAIGIYSADPVLYGGIQTSDDGDQKVIEEARVKSKKDNLVFGLPAPVIKDMKGNSVGVAKFVLNGDKLTLSASELGNIKVPFTIDPSVVVASASDFSSGNNDGMIDFGASGGISRGKLTGGSLNGGWSQTTGFNTASYGQTSVVHGGYIYVIGGPLSTEVQYAPINADGTIGTWSTTNSFSGNRYYHSSITYNGYIYVIGGYDGSSSSALSDVQYAAFNSDGTIGTWHSTSALPSVLYGATAQVYNGYVYVLGGAVNSGATAFSNQVQYAPINADGTIGTWSTTNSFSSARYFTTSVAYNGYLYLIGGYNGTNLSDVQYAKINLDGTVSAWMSTNGIINGRYGLTASVYNGYIYVAGGFDGSTKYNSVQYAPVYSSGALGSWSLSSNFTTARYFQSSVVYKGYVYLLGGYDGSLLYKDVQYARIDSAGQLAGFGTTTTSLSSARANVCSVAYKGYLYAIGGSTSDDDKRNVTTVQYSALNNSTGQTGSWSSTTALPQARGSAGCVVANGYLYVIGGYSTTGTTSNTITNSVYYIAINANGTLAGSWSTGTSLPSTGATQWATTYTAGNNTYIYAIGGNGSNGKGNAVYYATLNPNGTVGSWSTSSNSIPGTAVSNRGGAQVGKYIYTFGGSTSTSAIYVASITSSGDISSWISATSLGTSISYSGGVSVNGCIYSVGGKNASSVSQAVVQFACPANDGTIAQWYSAPNLSAATADMGVVSYGGYIYGVGGYRTAVTATIQYSSINNGGSGGINTWGTTTKLPSVLSSHSTVIANGYIYVLGGDDGTGRRNSVYYAAIKADGTLGTWQSTSSFINGRSMFYATAYNGYLYVMGGSAQGYGMYNDVQYAAINSDGTIANWHYTHNSTDDGATFVSGFNNSRFGFAGTQYNGYVYIFGGQGSKADVWNMNDAQYAKLNSDGTIGSWAATTTLPSYMQYNQAVAANGYVYLLGGIYGTNCGSGCGVNTYSYPTIVQYAPINSNGSLGSWSSTTAFSGGREYLSAGVYNGYVYIFGGDNGSGAYYNDVQFAPVNTNGTLGSWQTANGFSTSRNNSSVTISDGYIYLSGGYHATNDTACNATASYSCSDVQYAGLRSIARIGSYSKLIDLGTLANITGVSSNGSGVLDARYRAASTDGVFGSSKSLSDIEADIAPCSVSSLARYVLVTFSLDDSSVVGFPDSQSSVASLSDFTLNYQPLHPSPDVRLRTGKTLQNGGISPLDTCTG